jgi:acetyl-CoA carboxylase biotin carboxyl carrier protein
MDFREIQELIKLINKSNITEFKFQEGEQKVVIRTKEYSEGGVVQHQFIQQAAPAPVAAPVLQAAPTPVAPVQAPAPVADTTAPAAPAVDSSAGLLEITSPIVGTFYRSAGAGKEPYIKVGDSVDKGKVVCIVEAMKLFNEIESEVKGKIVKVVAEDASPVEYGQVLFLVDPKG